MTKGRIREDEDAANDVAGRRMSRRRKRLVCGVVVRMGRMGECVHGVRDSFHFACGLDWHRLIDRLGAAPVGRLGPCGSLDRPWQPWPTQYLCLSTPSSCQSIMATRRQRTIVIYLSAIRAQLISKRVV